MMMRIAPTDFISFVENRGENVLRDLPFRALELEPSGKRLFGSQKRSPVMDWNRVEGSWKQVKGKVKEQWGKLTDDDLSVINGSRDQLEGKIQERYGIAKDQVRREIDDWYNRQGWS